MKNLAVRTTNLSRRFGRKWAVKELTLQVPKGAAYGFLGRNGAGKTTTIRMLMGLLRPTRGDGWVLGYHSWDEPVEVKRRVGYVPEVPSFYDWLTVAQTIGLVANYRHDWDWNFSEQLLKEFRLDPKQKVKHLSKGMKAKLNLLLALGFKPQVLILDEPTFGLDPLVRREFIESILGLYQEEGRTIFVSSHLITEIAGLVDHLGIIDEGQLILEERVDEFLKRVKQIKLVFPQEAPRKIELEGLLRYRTDGREALLSVNNFSEQETIARLKELKPEHLEVNDLNLEDAFIEIVGGREWQTE